MPERIKHLAIYLTEEELTRLDYARTVLHMTRARVVREAVLEAISCAYEEAQRIEATKTLPTEKNAVEGA